MEQLAETVAGETPATAPTKWVCPKCGAWIVTHVPVNSQPECRSHQHRGKCEYMTPKGGK